MSNLILTNGLGIGETITVDLTATQIKNKINAKIKVIKIETTLTEVNP